MPVRPVAALLDATTRHRKASAYSLLAGFVFGFGWLIWIDAAVRGPYLWTPDGWRTLVISGSPLCLPAAPRARAVVILKHIDPLDTTGVPIALCSIFLLVLNVTETDDLRQLCHSYSFGLQQRSSGLLVVFAAMLGLMAIGSSVAMLVYYGSWQLEPSETWLSAAAAAATQFVFVAAIVFWVGRSHNASLL